MSGIIVAIGTFYGVKIGICGVGVFTTFLFSGEIGDSKRGSIIPLMSLTAVFGILGFTLAFHTPPPPILFSIY